MLFFYCVIDLSTTYLITMETTKLLLFCLLSFIFLFLYFLVCFTYKIRFIFGALRINKRVLQRNIRIHLYHVRLSIQTYALQTRHHYKDIVLDEPCNDVLFVDHKNISNIISVLNLIILNQKLYFHLLLFISNCISYSYCHLIHYIVY